MTDLSWQNTAFVCILFMQLNWKWKKKTVSKTVDLFIFLWWRFLFRCNENSENSGNNKAARFWCVCEVNAYQPYYTAGVGMYCMKCEGDYYFFSCQRISTAQQIYVSKAMIFSFGSQMNCRSLAMVRTSSRYVSSTCFGIHAILNTSISIVFRVSFYEEFNKKIHFGNWAFEKFIYFLLNLLLIESQLIIIERIHYRLMRV